ncbi:MAG TPA: protease pro-enzyme activation domain-containing protein [Pseudomonadales bacterium]|nr:protease pro-enzyme activation domain-containing protein [Pseudomonadales bacterium]
MPAAFSAGIIVQAAVFTRGKAFIKNAGRLAAALGLAAVFFPLGARAEQFVVRPQTLAGHVPSAITRFHLLPVHDFPKTNRMNLAISLPLRNEALLNEFLALLYKPGSSYYHKYLTPQQFTELFGPTEQDYNTVIRYAQLNGLMVKTTYSNRLLVDVSGSVDAVQKMLRTQIRVYNHPLQARMFFAPASEPQIDPGIPISHISGLDNYTIPRPAFTIKSASFNSSAVSPAFGSGPGGGYMGTDFRNAYAPGVTLDGTGQTVGLLELEGYYKSDIMAYEANAGLPNVRLTNVLVDSFSGPQASDTNGIIEVSLDIEMAISMATNATEIAVFEEANGGNVVDILNAIAANNFIKQISSSWLLGDSSSFDPIYKQMAAQGQSFFQASGDDGAFYSNNENTQQYADDTNITLVGGTTLSTAGAGGAWSSETVWNWYGRGLGDGGSGGGTNFNGLRIPSWQQGISMAANQGSTTFRNVPDVALTGDNIYVRATNMDFSIAGTSCAAPLWAGFTALVNQQAVAAGRPPVGFLNPALYAIGKSPSYTNDFHDITTGNNINPTVGNRWFAVPGYDLCTGWGTPNGQSLINALAPPDPLAVTPVAGFFATGFFGGSFTPNTQNYVLTNFSGSSITWSLINTSTWLNVSSTGGTLAAGGTASVTISLNSTANSFTVGTYNASLLFSNGLTHVAQNFQFAVQVSDLLVIAPVTGLSAAGALGGPFGPASQNFILTNLGTAPLNWQASSPAWLDLSPASGTVTNGKPFAVAASVNANANALASGVYNGQVAFTDAASGITQNGLFTLSVGQNLVQNSGFETGDFFGWTQSEPSSESGDSFVDDGSTVGFSPHSGTYFAAFGDSPSLGSLSETLMTMTNQPYLLSLWIYSPNVSQVTSGKITANTPNQFEVFWNGTNLFNHSNLPQFNFWSNLVFVVTAIKTNTTLQFSDEDTPWFFGLDDVNVTPIPLPNVQSVSRPSKTTFSLTWNTLPKLTYKVQYSTNLLTTNWFNLSTNTATGTTLSFTNAIGTNQYRFYRVVR